MVRKYSFSTTSLVVRTIKSSVGRRQRRHVHQVKKGRKGGRKVKKKKGGFRGSGRPRKKLKQSNMNGDLVENLDVEGFGDLFQVQHPSDITRVGFQNCGPQSKSRNAKKSQDGAMAVAGGKYDVMLVAEHGLYPPELSASEGWHEHVYDDEGLLLPT